MKTYHFHQLHEVVYTTSVKAATLEEAKALVEAGETEWETDYNTCVEAGEVELDEVR